MGLIYLVLIAFLDDTIDKASEIDTYATADGIDSALPSSWAQLVVGWGWWGTAVHLGWNWEGDGLHMDIVFLALLLKRMFFPPLNGLSSLLKNCLTIYATIYFWNVFSFGLYVCLYANTTIL